MTKLPKDTFNEADVETAMCLWEAFLDQPVLTPPVYSWLDAKRDAEGTIALRHWIIALAEACEAAWVADREAGIENIGFDWEHCPRWLDTHIRQSYLGLPPGWEAPATQHTFTAWVGNANGQGTVWIGSFLANCLDQAPDRAREACAQAWNLKDDADLHVLGIAYGDVKIGVWNDNAN